MGSEVRVWDPFVRLFHWSLVTAFAVAFLAEDRFETLHVPAGYTVTSLVVARIVWGFLGSRHARFSDFVHSPRAVIEYLKSMRGGRPPHFLGHNPAGGAMVIALLLMLLATTLTGLTAYGTEGEGPLGAALWTWSPTIEHQLEHVHEFLANATLALIGLHVTGVIASSLMHRENLVLSMFTGRKSAQ